MSVGVWQLVLTLFMILILFGAGKLPQVMSDIGKGLKGLKNGLRSEDEGQDPNR